MGTNYYVRVPCPDGEIELHIGKQSAGWPWCWAEPPRPRYRLGWLEYALSHPDLVVVDEYGREHGRLMGFVETRQGSDYERLGTFS